MRTYLTYYTMFCVLMIITLLVDKVPICVEAKQKREQTSKPTADLCIETNNLRCTDSTGNMNIEIYACENLHKSLNFEQARLTCSTLGNYNAALSTWKCYSNGYPIQCLQCLREGFKTKKTTTHVLYKNYMGEVDSRGLPAPVQHSLKRMTVLSLGINSIVILVSLLLMRRLSKVKGSPAVIVYFNFPYI